MTEKQKEQLEKFKKFSRWMYNDCGLALYGSSKRHGFGAQFLAALGIFNYIETLGSFLIGYFQKDTNGKILKYRKGKQKEQNIKTKTRDRFYKFLSYMGQEYKNLVDSHPEIYDELRCGLTHEFLPKNRKFSVVKAPEGLAEEQINNIKKIEIKTNNKSVMTDNYGIIFIDEQWIIFVPKLLIDFERAVKNLIKEVEEEKNKELLKNFFETATQINLENFT